MAKTKKSKKPIIKKIIEENKKSDMDTGSAQVQIALLTKGINDLNEHLKTHIHDYSTRRGLLKKVSVRRKFLKYLQVHDSVVYEKIIKKLKKIKV